jgi:hypothetical protein
MVTGFGLFGKPLIYAIFAVTLAESSVGHEGEERGPVARRSGS